MADINNPGGKGTITARRCTRCGTIMHSPSPTGLCPNCEAWKAKQK